MRKILLGNELLIIFVRVAETTFGIDIQNVISVLDYTGVRTVPLAPDYINSIMGCQGKIVTLFDIKTYFKYENTIAAPEKKVVYLKNPGLHIGILVDKVINIDYVPQSCIESIPEEESNSMEARFCKDMFVLHEDDPGIYWLDTKKIDKFIEGLNLS